MKAIIKSNTTIPTHDWEQGWDAVSTLAKASSQDGILTSDSNIEGTLNLPVCCKSEREALQSRFNNFAIITDDALIQGEDKNVLKILYDNANDGMPLSKTKAKSITSISTWFSNQPDIKDISILKDTGVTTFVVNPFKNSPNIEKVDFSNIKSLPNYCFGSNELKKVSAFYFPSVTSYSESMTGERIFVALPALTSVGGFSIGQIGKHVLFDLGVNCKSARCVVRNEGKISNIILRYNGVFSLTEGSIGIYGSKGCDAYFVPSVMVDNYKSTSPWSDDGSKIFAIGGNEWQTTMRSLAKKYAKENANWTDEQITNADYSDPYIDYRIFGIDPPIDLLQ